jgi:hypothetical protein
MPETKPSDLFLGVIEFFAILLPGAALVYLVQPWTAPLIPRRLLTNDPTTGGLAFGVLAFVVGHMLHALGGRFDKRIYDSWYLRRAEPNHHTAIEAAKAGDFENLTKDPKLSTTLFARALAAAGRDANGTSLYDWCLSYTRLRSPSAAAEVDRCQADSKFFRSFSVVMLVAMIVSAASRSPLGAVGSALILVFSLWRFCALRWEATKRVYEFYLLLHKYPPVVGEPPKGAA